MLKEEQEAAEPRGWGREQNSQELASLGEAHGVVAALEPGVRGQLPAHLPHLLVDVHEEAVLHVLGDQSRTWISLDLGWRWCQLCKQITGICGLERGPELSQEVKFQF